MVRPHKIIVASLGIAIVALGSAYRVESLRAYDTLPQTPHVELIVKLVRAGEATPV